MTDHNDKQRELPEVRESGTWTVSVTENGKSYLESSDFQHDVRLHIDGDFGTVGRRRQYAEIIAERLNNWQAAIAQAPAGYCIVPVEPTEEMIRAVYPYHWFIASMRGDAIRKYRAMIAAVPIAPSAPDRNAIIEECAKVCDDYLPNKWESPPTVLTRCAAIIRALKTTVPAVPEK